MTTPTTARDRQKATTADRFGLWIVQLADAIDDLGTNLVAKLTRRERAQKRRVVRLMLAAADGVSSPVLVAAILTLASSALVGMEVTRLMGMEVMRGREPRRGRTRGSRRRR
jgi:hypothetical protein